MRKLTSLVAALLLSVAAFAQAPQGFSYQAVVRDAQNAIVANQTVDVTLTLKAEIKSIPVQTYTEKHSVKTNANGLLTLVVGQGESSQKFSDFKWNLPEAIYNLETVTPYGTGTTQLLSVPYALYAEQAGNIDYAKLLSSLNVNDLSTILGLADYLKQADIQNLLATYALKTEIPTEVNLTAYAKTTDVDSIYAKKTDIPTAVNLSGYATKDTLNNFALKTSLASDYVTKETFENYVLSGGNAEAVDLSVYATNTKLNDTLAHYAKTADVDATYAKKTDLNAKANTADLATVATSGSYNDLTNKPTIPTVPTNVSTFTNDAAYVTLTQLQEQLAALQTEIERLQAFAPKFKKLKIQIVNPYAGNSSTWGYNTATVQFDGVSFTSGTKEFDVQVGSAMPLSVSLGTFKQTETNYYPYVYTYTITVNGQPFDNVAGTYDRPTGYVYNTMRTIGLTELEEKGMIEGGDTKLSNNQIGYSWLNGLSGSNNQAEAKEQEKDTYYNRSAQQNEKYIYADIVDALADYDATTDHKPYEIGRNNPRGGNKYFENKLSIAVTNEDGRMSERYGEGNRVGMTPKGYYWSSGTWVGEDGVRALGLTHNSNYAGNYLYYAPIYAKIPNFVYKMEYEQGEIYKVGTRKDELNGNMNGQNVGPFVDGENTIVITVKRVGGGEVVN